MNDNKSVLLVAIEVFGQVQQEVFPGNAKMEEKGQFLRIKSADDRTILAFYPIARVVGGRRLSNEDILAQMASMKQTPENTTAEGEPKNAAETVHPSDGTEGRETSPDR